MDVRIASHGRPAPADTPHAPARDLRAWLQERRYAHPYHWSYVRNNLLAYDLRTLVALDLLGLAAPAPNVSRPRLLDIGCGDGRFLGDVASRVEAWGVDRSSRALGFARRLVPRAHVLACAADALCFPDGSFDAVTMLDVIEHVPDEREALVLAEARRVLRPGGHLVISTNTDRSAVEWKHYRHYALPRFRALFDGPFRDLRLVGLIPYFPTLRLWMQVPLVWRWFRGRVRTCRPEEGQIVLGIATRT